LSCLAWDDSVCSLQRLVGCASSGSVFLTSRGRWPSLISAFGSSPPTRRDAALLLVNQRGPGSPAFGMGFFHRLGRLAVASSPDLINSQVHVPSAGEKGSSAICYLARHAGSRTNKLPTARAQWLRPCPGGERLSTEPLGLALPVFESCCLRAALTGRVYCLEVRGPCIQR